MDTLLRPMHIVPYTIRPRDNMWFRFSIFLSQGGRSLWTEDPMSEADLRSVLADNGFPIVSAVQKDDIWFVELDQSKLKLTDFYLWEDECPKTSEKDVWRSFKIPCGLMDCDIFQDTYWSKTGLPLTASIREHLLDAYSGLRA